MLKEYHYPGKADNNLRRRYFSDENFDLYVWLDSHDNIVGFQLCYDLGRNERCLSWAAPSSYFHHLVDDGENRPGRPKSTPVLLPDGAFDADPISKQFKVESQTIEGRIAEFVYCKLTEFRKNSIL